MIPHLDAHRRGDAGQNEKCVCARGADVDDQGLLEGIGPAQRGNVCSAAIHRS